MKYLVYGAGAVGGVVGAHLHRSGQDATLVARGEHITRIREHGLRLDTADGELVLDVPAVRCAAEAHWSADTVVLLCVKSHQTAAALEDLAGHAPPDTPVVSVQNGVSNEPAILRLFEATYAVCVMLPSTHLEPGVVVQKCHPTPGILDIGRVPRGTDELTGTVSADLRTAGFESVPRSDIMAWKYRKLLMNLGNGIDAVCRPDEAAEEPVRRARAEGEHVLAEAGIPVVSARDDAVRRGDILRSRTDDGFRRGGSTWQSLIRGSVTRGSGVEIDHLSGEIVLVGRWHGVPTPVNALVQRTTADLARRGGPPRSLDAADLLAQLG